jgi:hypothetical protein
MIFMCNALAALSPEHLRLCISTLGEFGRQSDTNISLTAAESFLWGVSDARSFFAEKLRCIEPAGNRRPMVFYPYHLPDTSRLSGETIRGNLPFPRYAPHSMVVGSELYLINRVE